MDWARLSFPGVNIIHTAMRVTVSATSCADLPNHCAPRRRLPAFAGLVVFGLALICGCGQSPAPAPVSHSNEKPEEVSATTGTAPGYVDDQVCARCHAELFKSFQSTGMARSFFPADQRDIIEDFGSFQHAASQQNFEMKLDGGRYVFRRYLTDDAGQPIHDFRQQIDWILGSGNNARTYLYQTPAGELYQLPIAWYSEEQRWGMAPGFDRPDHEGVTRRVRRECIFCHNAYPEVARQSDTYGASQIFPHRLPHGIGCQRCHGPGADHVQFHTDGSIVSSQIVNPAKLKAELRDDVCDQCHLQPSVALFGIRRFGRDDYSFVPGQPLNDYIVPLDIVDGHRSADDRFEINHHPYRLRQSRCFEASDGALNCLNCHDPHRKLEPEQQAAHYRAACQKCHSESACRRPERPIAADTSNCVACHMPRRRTQDVVHVIATDHRITRRPPEADELLARLPESEPRLDDVLLGPADQGTDLGDIYRTTAVLRVLHGRHATAADHLASLLARSGLKAAEPALDLAGARLALRQPTAAIDSLQPLLDQDPANPAVFEMIGLAKLQMGMIDAAEKSFRQALHHDPLRTLAALNLGRLELTRNRADQASDQLEQVVRLHPTLPMAWYHLGEALARQSKWKDAAHSYQRALEIDPDLKDAYFGIERSLQEQGLRDEADRFRRFARQRKGLNPAQ